MSAADSIKDFAVQIDKTLSARRLYQPVNTAYTDAHSRLVEKCRAAAGDAGFTLIIGATDLFYDKFSVLSRPQDDSFFFPLYRDGLRALTFTPNVTAEELTALLEVIESSRREASGDTVNELWRRDLSTVLHKSVDGIGDSEAEEEAGNEMQAQVRTLSSQVRDPAAPSRPAAPRREERTFDAPPLRRALEHDPRLLRVEAEEIEQIRAELGAGRDEALLERFIEILLVIVRSPARTLEPAVVGPVFQRLTDAYWRARDYARVAAILGHVNAAATQAPNAEYRAALADAVRRFLTVERLNILVLDFIGGALPPATAAIFWDLVPGEVVFPLLLDTWSRLPEGETRGTVLDALRKRIAGNSDLLQRSLLSDETPRIRAALNLLDEATEHLFAADVLRLTTHPEESVRVKALAAASRNGGTAAVEALWKAMESDPSKSVRLYAFRAMSTVRWPELPARLQDLVSDPRFAERPLWEREKYVRLLGESGGAAVAPLFDSWIPTNRWMWKDKDLDTLALALRGLGATGEAGMQRVRTLAAGGGKPAEVARTVLEALSHAESGDATLSRRMPTAGNVRRPEES